MAELPQDLFWQASCCPCHLLHQQKVIGPLISFAGTEAGHMVASKPTSVDNGPAEAEGHSGLFAQISSPLCSFGHIFFLEPM